MRLRVASYNIRKALGLDRRRRPERVLSVLNDMKADVVVLQEADRRLGPRPAALPRGLVERESAYRIADLAQNDVSLGWHGNAVLLREGLEVDEVGHFDLPGLEPRGAVMVRIGALTLVGTHLGLLRRWRQLQMRAILDHLEDRAATTLVAGDFNEWSPQSGFEPWAGVLRVVAPGPSYHTARPIARLDRFAHGERVTLRATGVHGQGPALRASDHLPVWAEVEVRGRRR